jgi:hypothetical protein
VNSGGAGFCAYYASSGTVLSSASGATVTAGDFVATSDGTLKNIQGTIQNPLDKVLQLRGVHYTWNDTAKRIGMNDRKQIGVVAQDIEQLFPELIAITPDGYKAVSYDRLVPLLIEAIKELTNKVNKQ